MARSRDTESVGVILGAGRKGSIRDRIAQRSGDDAPRVTWEDFPDLATKVREVFRIDPDEPLPMAQPERDRLEAAEHMLGVCNQCIGLEHCGSYLDAGYIEVPLPRMTSKRMGLNGFEMPGGPIMMWHAKKCRFLGAAHSEAVAATEREQAAEPNRYIEAALDDFAGLKEMGPLIETARAYLQGKLWLRGKSIIVLGATSTGKTHYLAAVANAAKLLGAGRYFVSEATVAGQDATDEDKFAEKVFRKACDTDLLVLDDVGATTLGDWGANRVSRLIDLRYGNRMGMIISSNMTPTELRARIGARLWERLWEESKVHTFPGENRRNERHAENQSLFKLDGGGK